MGLAAVNTDYLGWKVFFFFFSQPFHYLPREDLAAWWATVGWGGQISCLQNLLFHDGGLWRTVLFCTISLPLILVQPQCVPTSQAQLPSLSLQSGGFTSAFYYYCVYWVYGKHGAEAQFLSLSFFLVSTFCLDAQGIEEYFKFCFSTYAFSGCIFVLSKCSHFSRIFIGFLSPFFHPFCCYCSCLPHQLTWLPFSCL